MIHDRAAESVSSDGSPVFRRPGTPRPRAEAAGGSKKRRWPVDKKIEFSVESA